MLFITAYLFKSVFSESGQATLPWKDGEVYHQSVRETYSTHISRYNQWCSNLDFAHAGFMPSWVCAVAFRWFIFISIAKQEVLLLLLSGFGDASATTGTWVLSICLGLTGVVTVQIFAKALNSTLVCRIPSSALAICPVTCYHKIRLTYLGTHVQHSIIFRIVPYNIGRRHFFSYKIRTY